MKSWGVLEDKPSPAHKIKCFYEVNVVNLQWSCWRDKIMSIVEHNDLKPHWDLGYTLSLSFCSLPKTTWAKTILNNVQQEDSSVTVANIWSLLFLYRVTMLQSLCSTVPSSQHWQSRLNMRSTRTPSAHLMASSGMPSNPGAFPRDNLSIALLSSPAVSKVGSPPWQTSYRV